MNQKISDNFFFLFIMESFSAEVIFLFCEFLSDKREHLLSFSLTCSRIREVIENNKFHLPCFCETGKITFDNVPFGEHCGIEENKQFCGSFNEKGEKHGEWNIKKKRKVYVCEKGWCTDFFPGYKENWENGTIKTKTKFDLEGQEIKVKYFVGDYDFPVMVKTMENMGWEDKREEHISYSLYKSLDTPFSWFEETPTTKSFGDFVFGSRALAWNKREAAYQKMSKSVSSFCPKHNKVSPCVNTKIYPKEKFDRDFSPSDCHRDCSSNTKHFEKDGEVFCLDAEKRSPIWVDNKKKFWESATKRVDVLTWCCLANYQDLIMEVLKINN